MDEVILVKTQRFAIFFTNTPTKRPRQRLLISTIIDFLGNSPNWLFQTSPNLVPKWANVQQRMSLDFKLKILGVLILKFFPQQGFCGLYFRVTLPFHEPQKTDIWISWGHKYSTLSFINIFLHFRSRKKKKKRQGICQYWLKASVELCSSRFKQQYKTVVFLDFVLSSRALVKQHWNKTTFKKGNRTKVQFKLKKKL